MDPRGRAIRSAVNMAQITVMLLTWLIKMLTLVTTAVPRLSGKQKCAIATKEVVFAQHEYGQVRLTNRIQLEKVGAVLIVLNIFLQYS